MSRNKHRQLVRWIKRALMVAFVAAVVAMVVMAWMPKPLPVETAEAVTGSLTVDVVEDGRTRVKDRFVISAPLAGNLARIELQPGDDVEEGTVLARILPMSTPLMDTHTREQAEAGLAAAQAGGKQAKAQIERAKAALAFAEQDLRQLDPLVEQGVASTLAAQRAKLDVETRTAELASARFAARVAAHEQQMAKSALGRIDGTEEHRGDQLVVTSPISGRVLAVHRESEGVTAAGAPLVEIGDPSALEIVVDVLTADATQIQRGATTVIDRWGGKPLQAKVRLVEPSAFTRMSALGVEEQRVNAVIDLDQPYEDWESLGEGYRVEARIEIWSAESVLKVPSSALFRHDAGWAVFVVSEHVARPTVVEVGRRSGLEAQILAGLTAGDRVIVHPSDRVADGTEVVWR